MRSGGGEGVDLGQNARHGIRRRHALLAELALGDVFAGNQDNRIIARPPHGLGIFAHPERRAVLADFADLPAMRTAEFAQAGRHMVGDQLPVFRKKNAQHRLSNQLGDRIAKLSGAKNVHRQHCAGWTDHEIHHGVVFEYFPPLLLAASQRFHGALALRNKKGRHPDYRYADPRFDARDRWLDDTRQKEGQKRETRAAGANQYDASHIAETCGQQHHEDVK